MSQASLYSTTSVAPVPPHAAAPAYFFDGRPIDVVVIDGEPWFVAAQVAEVLGHRAASDLTRLLKDKHRGTHSVRTPGGLQTVSVISEPGFYQAVLSRKPTAKALPGMAERIERFQDWVSDEVLPSIRRTGTFSVRPPAPAFDPTDPAALRHVLLGYTEKVIELEAKVEAAAPAVAFQQALVETDGTWGLQQTGKALGQAPNGFVNWLIARGDLYRRAGSLCGRQYLIDRGILATRWEDFGGKPRPVTKVTGKGVAHYAKVLGVRPPEPPRQGLLAL